jgi:hypothetical protein
MAEGCTGSGAFESQEHDGVGMMMSSSSGKATKVSNVEESADG